MPSVSVIIPTYNRCGLLKEAVESVLQQTYADLEVLVVDDGSSDDTRSVVAHILDRRIRYLHKHNGGQSSALNLAFIKATGKYIAYLDEDDLWPPDYLKTMVNELDTKKDYGLAYARVVALYPDGTKKESTRTQQCKSGWITKYFFEVYPGLMPSGACLRRSACQGVFWDEALRRSPDYDFFLRVSTRLPFLFVPNAHIIKRWYPENLSSSKDPISFIEKAHILERFLFHLDGRRYVSPRSIRRKISRNYRKAAKILYALGNRDAAISLIEKAIRYYPMDMRLFVDLLAILLKTKNQKNVYSWQMPPPLPAFISVTQDSADCRT